MEHVRYRAETLYGKQPGAGQSLSVYTALTATGDKNGGDPFDLRAMACNACAKQASPNRLLQVCARCKNVS